MEKEIIVTDYERTIKELEDKVLELEKTNLTLQEYFSRTIDLNNSPFNGNPLFSCLLKMTVDLEIHRIVWSHAGNHEYYCSDKKLFLSGINTFISKNIALPDQTRFADIVNQYANGHAKATQTLFRFCLPNEEAFWALACFEKANFEKHSSSYLQIQFLRLDESKEIASLLAEFANKIEKADQYQKVELLTDRQREILSFLGKGLTSKEIAEELKISFHTVEAHRKSIAKRIKINKRAALISLAVEAGMLH